MSSADIKYELLEKLDDAIWKFNTEHEELPFGSDEHYTFKMLHETLTDWMYDIRELYKKWKAIPESPEYEEHLGEEQIPIVENVKNFETDITMPAKWFLTHELPNDTEDIFEMFRILCKIHTKDIKDPLSLVKWLYNLGSFDRIPNYNSELIIDICYHGNEQIAKWFYSNGWFKTTRGKIHHDWTNEAFRAACIARQESIAKWLYSLGEVNIEYGSGDYEEDTSYRNVFYDDTEFGIWLRFLRTK